MGFDSEVSLIYGARIPVEKRNGEYDFSQVEKVAKKFGLIGDDEDEHDAFYDDLTTGAFEIPDTNYVIKEFSVDDEDVCVFIILKETRYRVLRRHDPSPKKVIPPTEGEISRFEDFLENNNLPYEYEVYMAYSGG